MFSFIFRYPGLTIKYVRGADPIIKLLDDDEFAVEVKHHLNLPDCNKELFVLSFNNL